MSEKALSRSGGFGNGPLLSGRTLHFRLRCRTRPDEWYLRRAGCDAVKAVFDEAKFADWRMSPEAACL